MTPDPIRTSGGRSAVRPAVALLAAPAVSFIGIIRFRFEGSSSRSCRNLSPPRRTPLQARRTKTPWGCSASTIAEFSSDFRPKTAFFGLLASDSIHRGEAAGAVASTPTGLIPTSFRAWTFGGTVSGVRLSQIRAVGVPFTNEHSGTVWCRAAAGRQAAFLIRKAARRRAVRQAHGLTLFSSEGRELVERRRP
jgi:hypothetical protein